MVENLFPKLDELLLSTDYKSDWNVILMVTWLGAIYLQVTAVA